MRGYQAGISLLSSLYYLMLYFPLLGGNDLIHLPCSWAKIVFLVRCFVLNHVENSYYI